MKELMFGGARLNSLVGDFGLLILRGFAGISKTPTPSSRM
jgi:hypothetical protein